MSRITGGIIILLVNTFAAQAQADTLNKFNSNGKKQGYWLCYLDKEFTLTDSSKDLYDNGQNLTCIGKRRSAGLIIIDSTATVRYKQFRVLNGKLLFFDKANTLLMSEEYYMGHPVKYTSYCYYDNHPESKGNYQEIIDFTKLYNNVKGTYYSEFRSCMGGSAKKYYFRKGKKKWKAYRIKV
jgi:hypothetical protein